MQSAKFLFLTRYCRWDTCRAASRRNLSRPDQDKFPEKNFPRRPGDLKAVSPESLAVKVELEVMEVMEVMEGTVVQAAAD